jgi:signal transduction histidine kinase
MTLRLHHDHGTLAVRIEDDGRGFDPALTPDGAGLRNIRDRIQTLRGTVKLTSSPGRGTVLTISLPWSRRQPNTAPTDLRVRQS